MLTRLLLLTFGIASAAFADDGIVLPLKRSDVVFMGAARKEVYQIYGATVVDWGGHAYADTDKSIADFRARVKTAQDLGIHYNAGIGMLTEFLGMIKSEPNHQRAICRTIDQKPITVPWLWDHKVDGELGKAYWFCSNSPLYKAYLKRLAARAMAGQPDGFHIDDFGGTTGSLWNGGCFCESCIPAFREYLKTQVSKETLAKLGIDNLESFDYAKFLLEKHAKDADDFKKRRSQLPLDAEFRTFQALAAGKVVREVQEHAAKLLGKPIPRCVNGNPPSQQALVVRPHVDHYSCEIWFNAQDKKLINASAFAYKCADMLNRAIAGTADGHSWAWVSQTGHTRATRMWITEAYASGHTFMAPSEHQWCYTKEKGTHWLKNNPDHYADIYQFVRKNSALFDGFESSANVGVLFSHRAWRKGKKDPQAIAGALLDANIPFALIPAGDELLDLRLNPASLARFDKLILPSDPMLDPDQTKLLDSLPAEKKLTWKDPATLLTQLPSPIGITSAPNIRILPRQTKTSLALHVLNRNYDFTTDQIAPQQNITITLTGPLAQAAAGKTCTLHTPGAPSVTLPIQPKDGTVSLTLPTLDLWSILLFQ